MRSYQKRIRVRACGICLAHGQLLLVKHVGLGSQGIFWSPPGGEPRLYESTEEAVRREFKEETGIEVAIERFLFTNEFIKQGSLHALEVFYKVRMIGGALTIGNDPELDEQLIADVKFVTFAQLGVMEVALKHNVLHGVETEEMLLNKHGHFIFCQ